MPIYQISNKKVNRVKPTEFKLEKDLQKLIEENLDTFFNCRFIASEYSTGNLHSGRIDTLAISEDNNPVIIEYKKVASSQLVTQSLYYLHWIIDHKGDFQVAANAVFGEAVEVDWSDIRVICIAPEYKKFDLHAVQVMGSNLELWQYKIYENNVISLEEISGKSTRSTDTVHGETDGKNPKMVEVGRKGTLTRKATTYTIEDHLNKINGNLLEILNELRDFIVGLESSVEERPRKYYIAYKTTQNFVTIEVQKKKLMLFLKLNPSDLGKLPSNARDVTNIGHFGTGDLELAVRSEKDVEHAKQLIIDSFKNIGG